MFGQIQFHKIQRYCNHFSGRDSCNALHDFNNSRKHCFHPGSFWVWMVLVSAVVCHTSKLSSSLVALRFLSRCTYRVEQSHYVSRVSHRGPQSHYTPPQKRSYRTLVPCTKGGHRKSNCPQKGIALYPCSATVLVSELQTHPNLHSPV